MGHPKKQNNDSIPKPTYKNLKMMKSLQHQEAGGYVNQVPPTTAKDSSLYKTGYMYGLKNWRTAPKTPPPFENKIYQGGRWEGQNVGKKMNYGTPPKPTLMQRVKNFFFN